MNSCSLLQLTLFISLLSIAINQSSQVRQLAICSGQLCLGQKLTAPLCSFQLLTANENDQVGLNKLKKVFLRNAMHVLKDVNVSQLAADDDGVCD